MSEHRYTAFYRATGSTETPYEIDVPDVGTTQTRNADEIELMARELVAIVKGLNLADVVVDVLEAPTTDTPGDPA